MSGEGIRVSRPAGACKLGAAPPDNAGFPDVTPHEGVADEGTMNSVVMMAREVEAVPTAMPIASETNRNATVPGSP